jgi:N6-adenosine-specific RNA methylase IME4
MLRFQRYDMLLEEPWLETHLGIKLAPKMLDRLRRLDGPDYMPELYEMAAKIAADQVKLEHFTGP